MTSILMILGLPEAMARRYHEGIRAAFPEIAVTLVNHVAKADPYLADMDVLITQPSLFLYSWFYGMAAVAYFAY